MLKSYFDNCHVDIEMISINDVVDNFCIITRSVEQNKPELLKQIMKFDITKLTNQDCGIEKSLKTNGSGKYCVGLVCKKCPFNNNVDNNIETMKTWLKI